MSLNLLKLCVGAESVEDLSLFQAARMTESRALGRDETPRHVTRMWPRREAEILGGGSLYWVIRGEIQARQRILGFDPVTGEDGIRRCAILLDSEIVLTERRPRRPFQGWRYLTDTDTPADLGDRDTAPLPEALRRGLSDLGIL